MSKSILAVLTALILSLLFNTASTALDKGDTSDKVQVKGYTRKDGTKVEGYSRSKPAKEETVEVKGYTKKDGTVVKGYTRKKPSK